ncbi:MAG: aminoacyl-tRNA hydrolase, partial [Rhizonema sp. PD38]|nr:aminoacyl-tRNA hydrolase [Rhizonema sp. PD38]
PKDSASSAESDSVSFVLGRFSKAETDIMSLILQHVVECLELCLKQGVEKAMNICNSRTIYFPKS